MKQLENIHYGQTQVIWINLSLFKIMTYLFEPTIIARSISAFASLFIQFPYGDINTTFLFDTSFTWAFIKSNMIMIID